MGINVGKYLSIEGVVLFIRLKLLIIAFGLGFGFAY